MNIQKDEEGSIIIPTDTVLNVLVAVNSKGDIYEYQEEIYHRTDDNTIIKEILTEPKEIYIETILQEIEEDGADYLVWSEKGVLSYQIATVKNLLKNLK